MSTPVGSNAEGVGDDAVREATGRDRAEWFVLLDEAGAATWPHKDIAGWLVREHGVDGWWAQGVTVGFEQARGIRRPGQRQDGTYEASVSRTVSLDAADALRALAAIVTCSSTSTRSRSTSRRSIRPRASPSRPASSCSPR